MWNWEEFAGVLQERLRSIPAINNANIQTYVRYIDDAASVDEFDNTFMSPTENILHFWMSTRVAGKSSWGTDGDLNTIIVDDVVMDGAYFHNDRDGSELKFQKIIDEVRINLNTGDRTLGGLIDSLSLPEILVPMEGARINQVFAHGGKFMFKIRRIEAVPA